MSPGKVPQASGSRCRTRARTAPARLLRPFPVRMNGTFVQTALFPRVTTGKVIALRVLLTVLGCSLMVLGAFLEWQNGTRGVDLGYADYLPTAFDLSEEALPDLWEENSGLRFATSVAIPALLLAALALLGVFGKGRLTRFAAGLAVLIYVVFLVTLIGAGPGIGVPVVLAGGVIAFIGGLLGRVSVSQGA